MVRVVFGILVCLPFAACGQAHESAPRTVPRGPEHVATVSRSEPHVVIDAGALRLDVSFATTADVFHVVDQLSRWSPYTHAHYEAWAKTWPLDDVDREMLAVHAAMRRARGWGNGFEQGFYVDDPIADAGGGAMAAGLLTSDEVAIERVILARFERRIVANAAPETSRLRAFAARLDASTPKLREVATELANFVQLEHAPLSLPTYFFADPDDTSYGGEMNGGRLVVEVPPHRDVTDVVLHEALHAFLRTRKDELERAAREEPSLTFETLNEGIAHALAPGLVSSRPGADPLAEDVARDRERGKTLEDPYARFHAYALALRPRLARALADGTTLSAFLPGAIEEWRALTRSTPPSK